MTLADFNAFTHLQRRIKRMAKNAYTTHGWISEFGLSTIAVEISKERTISIFFAMEVVIEVCFKTHGQFEGIEAVVE